MSFFSIHSAVAQWLGKVIGDVTSDNGALNTSHASQTLHEWWSHQMETFLRVTGPLWGESTGDRWISLTKATDAELWRGFFYICAWTNGWADNRSAIDLARHSAHYAITVMAISNNVLIASNVNMFFFTGSEWTTRTVSVPRNDVIFKNICIHNYFLCKIQYGKG